MQQPLLSCFMYERVFLQGGILSQKCNSGICPAICRTGCFCKPGYSRKDGVCIPTDECQPKCSDPNEEYTTCGNSCKEECNSQNCPAVCETGCFCKPGYSRKDGTCVPTKQCTPKCSDPNEQYLTCGNSCKEQCNSLYCPALCMRGMFLQTGLLPEGRRLYTNRRMSA
uniref:TIL domain-containing protein n=1 Tax=Phlebotomus papatasi TaxID=29031 RepID=A0A1B0CYV1_PHLPP